MVYKKRETDFAKGLHGRLPTLELMVYTIALAGSVFYICYCVYRDSKEYAEYFEVDLEQGWSILNVSKDHLDIEWDFWCVYIWSSLPFLVGHIVIGTFMGWLLLPLQKCIFTLFSAVSLSYLVGWMVVVTLLLQCALCFSVSFWRSVRLTWSSCLLMLALLNVSAVSRKMLNYFSDDEYLSHAAILLLSMSNLRYTSFCLERCSTHFNGSADGFLNHSFTDLLYFTFYFPLSLSGPLVTYDNFRNQVNIYKMQRMKLKVFSIILLSIRVLIWALLADFSLHYFYMNALLQHDILVKLSTWTLAGIGYCQGQFFMVKYFMIWGVSSLVCKLDGIEAPKLPKCVSYVYLYTEMWACFDRGLYNFMKRYIYIPLGGSHCGQCWRIMASLCCFAYVYYWHGLESYLFMWCLLSFIVVNLENFGKTLLSFPAIRKLENEKLSPAMVRRLHAVCSVPTLHLSSLSIFYFFGESFVGNFYMKMLLLETTFLRLFLLYFFMYTSIQVAMEIRQIQQKQGEDIEVLFYKIFKTTDQKNFKKLKAE